MVLAPAIQQMAVDSGYDYAQATKSSCGPYIGDTPSVVSSQEAHICAQFNRNVLSYACRNSAIHLVVLAGYWNNESSVEWGSDGGNGISSPISNDSLQIFQDSLMESVRSLRNCGKRVIIFQDAPSYNFNPRATYATLQMLVRLMLAHILDSNVPDQSGIAAARHSYYDTYTQSRLSDALSRLSEVTLYDLRQALCPATDQCRYLLNDQPLYTDEHHLSLLGARYALRDFHLPPAQNM
jgi:hypothetical protein